MSKKLTEKSSVNVIRARFDADVERFSNLTTGQSATIDAPLAMELITQAAVRATAPVRRVLDVGCGAGNNTIKLRLELQRDFTADLIDLSEPMVSRAVQRVAEVNRGEINSFIGDFRTVSLPEGTYDVLLAAAVLHHLRDDADWLAAFRKMYSLLRPGGSVWVTDLVAHEVPAV